MSTRRHISKKASLESTFTPAANPLKTRGFGKGIQARSAELPKTNLLQTRPIGSPQFQQPETRSIEEQMEGAERFGYNAAAIPVNAPATSPPPPPVQRKEGGLGNGYQLPIQRVEPIMNRLNQLKVQQFGQAQTGERTSISLEEAQTSFVVQQNSASDRIQRTLQSPRFSETPELESAHDDKKHLKKGSTGLSVRILQQALLDASYPLPKYGVDGIFGGETEIAVKAFQKAHGLKDDGIVGPKTMQALDTSFLDHGAMAGIPQSQIPSTAPTEGVEWDSAAIPPELLEGTRALTAEEKAEVERRQTTEVQAPKGGTLPVFKMNIATHSDSYEKRVEEKTNQTIDRQYNYYAKGKAADRKDPNKLYKWDVIEKVASISKKETDRVFGNYAKGKPFKAGLNLFDAWEEKEKQFAAGGAKYEQDKVEWRVEKIFGGKEIRKIDEEHGAVQSRATEKGILDTVKNRIIAKRRSELIEIHKGWGGFADGGKVYLQRFISSDAAKNRGAMWRNFQTVVHEYIHTLEHSKHKAYRAGLDELKGGKTYREGMTDYFTKIVLESTTYDDQLRKDVEGPYYDPAIKHPIPLPSFYDEATNAEAVVGVVGIRNAMAAFFAGRIDLIGG